MYSDYNPPPQGHYAKIQEQELNLHQFLLVLRKRYPYLIAVFFLVVVLAALYTFRQTPLYQGESLLVFEPNSESAVDFTKIDIGGVKTAEFLETQKKIITSRTVVGKVLSVLNITDEFSKPQESVLRTLLAFVLPEKPEKEKTASADPIEAFSRNISVESIRNSHLMQIKVLDPDPEKAAQYVNTLTKAYLEHDLEDRRSASSNAFTWLSEQVAVLKAKVAKSEMDVLKYKQEEELSSLEKRQSTLDEKIAELNDSYSKADMERLEKEAILREIKNLGGSKAGNLPELLESAQLKLLKEESSKVEIQLANLAKKFKPNHPEVIRLSSQLSLIREKLAEEARKKVQDLEIETRIIRNKEENITSNLQALKKQAMRLAEQAIQYGVLKREAESNKQMYDVLLERLKETDIGSSVVANNIRVVDEAKVPDRPVKPNIPKNMAIAVAIGLFLGTGVCFLIEYFDNSIKNEHDVAMLLHLPLLGAVPKEKPKIAVEGNAAGSVNRSYQESKAQIAFHRKDHMLNTLLVTSAVPGEGKTTTSASLGMAFARSGTKVLMVDADIMKPRLHKVFAMENDCGLSNFLVKHEDPAKLIRETVVENLHIMPSGLIPPNPAELLGSERIKELAELLKTKFDLVIFDTPPVSATRGVSHLASFVDGTVLVIRANETANTLVRKAVETLKDVNANILGVILTGMKKSSDYYHYYYYYSGYGKYGEKKRKSSKFMNADAEEDAGKNSV